MQAALRIAGWANLLPGALVCLVAPAALFRWLELPFDATAAVLMRYLGVAFLALGVMNAAAAARPSVWKPVIALDLVLFGGSALVPLSRYLLEGGVHWFWWANAALDAAMFSLVAASAIRTFWMK